MCMAGLEEVHTEIVSDGEITFLASDVSRAWLILGNGVELQPVRAHLLFARACGSI